MRVSRAVFDSKNARRGARSNPRGEFYDGTGFYASRRFRLVVWVSYAAGREPSPHTLVRVLLKARPHMRRDLGGRKGRGKKHGVARVHARLGTGYK